MKKSLIITNIALIICTLVLGGLYNGLGGLYLKGIASAFFVAIGGVNVWFAYKNSSSNKKYLIMMIFGLFFGMLGDILLNIEFIVGAVFFAVGHVFYFIAFCCLLKFKWYDLIAGGVVAAGVLMFMNLSSIFVWSTLMQVACNCYAVIIAFMFGKAIANFIRERNLINLLIMVGTFLFVFSDLMLLFGGFTTLSGMVFDHYCLATYYPAQALLAFVMIFQAKEIQK